MQKNKVLITLATLGLYLIATGISYSVFSKSNILGGTPSNQPSAQEAQVNDYEALVFDPNAPKTEACPLNGAKYSEEQKEWWEGHRPLGVMIENHLESRPQSGLTFADVVYEAVAEGGITRFLSIYYCQDAGIVGPVRSARTYFLDFISEYGSYPLYAHVGGANTPGPANALGQIGEYGWNSYNDLSQFNIGFPTFRRDEARLGRAVATEHTMYSTTSRLWEVGADRGLTNEDEDGEVWDEDFVAYEFADDARESARPLSQEISVEFWSNQPSYAVNWVYDTATNSYARENGGEPHLDNNPDKQLHTKNLIMLFMNESNANDGYPGNAHLLYGTKGSGKAFIFQNGEQTTGTWKKTGREGRTQILDSGGKEITFTRGQMWFQILPTGADVAVN